MLYTNLWHKVWALFTLLMATQSALADITVGVSLPLTGPSSALGIAIQKQIRLWPPQIAGEKLNVVLYDDATDPTAGIVNARKFSTEHRVDVVFGSASTPVAIAMADALAEAGIPQITSVPSVLPPGKDKWHFRLAQSTSLMAQALFAHMQKQGVKTVGFIGYSMAYGDSWLKDLDSNAARFGLKIVDVERFGMADTSVTAQALKLTAQKPDAILIVAAGSGAAMPHKALVERGYKGLIYQTHGAASQDLIRVGGKDVEGAFLVAGPFLVAEQLPAHHPSKAAATAFVTTYEQAYGPHTRNVYAASAADVITILQKALPSVLKRTKPGTAEFRSALRDALETLGSTALANGVLEWRANDHWGYGPETPVMVKIVQGAWQVQ